MDSVVTSTPVKPDQTATKAALSQWFTKSLHSGVSKLKEAPEAVANASRTLKRTFSVETTTVGPTVDYEMAKFSQVTSFHGVMRWYNCTNWKSRIFWMAVVFGALAAFVVEVQSLVADLLNKPTVTEVNFVYDQLGIVFPTVTICNFAIVQKSKVDGLRMPEDALKYVLAAYLELESLNDYNQTTMNELYKAFGEFSSNYTAQHGTDFNITQFYIDNGFDCEAMVKKCWFGGREVPHCCQHAQPVLTSMGLCYEFRNFTASVGKDRQSISGPNYGAKFQINAMVDEYIDSILQPFHEIGVVFFVHDSRELPYISTGGYAVSPGHKVYAGVTFKHYLLLPPSQWGKCQKTWANSVMPDHHQYTYANCQADCIAKRFLDACKCTPLKYRTHTDMTACEPMDLYNCSVRNQWDNYSITDESWYKPCNECNVECERWEVQAQISYSRIEPTREAKSLLRESHEETYAKDNFLQISIYLQATSYTEYTQMQGSGVVQTLSNIGGCMGMFIGASLITVVEVVVFLIKLVWTTMSKGRQNRLVQKIESCEDLQDLAKRHRLNSRSSIEDYYTQDGPRKSCDRPVSQHSDVSVNKRHRMNSRTSSLDDFYSTDEPQKFDRPVSQTSDSSRDSGQFSQHGPERKEAMAFYIPSPVFSESET